MLGSTGSGAIGTGVPKGILPPSGTGQARGSGTGIPNGIFPPSGTNPKLTASGGANSSVPTRATSCGLCDVIIPQVQVQYFRSNPDRNATCTQSIGAGASITPPPAPALVRRRLAPRNGTFVEGIVVSDDYTFTSPSMYVVMSQGIQVTDLCGTIGKSIASAVVPVSDLSTVSYDLPSGAVLTDAIVSAKSYTKPLLTQDLACPTWGISGNWNPRPEGSPLIIPGGVALNIPDPAAPGATSVAVISEVQDETHVGAPWYPIIVLPHEVLSLDPLWKSCVGRLINPSFPIFDPPHALEAETVLAPSTAPAQVQAEVTGGPSSNGGLTSEQLPVLTGAGGLSSGGGDNLLVNVGGDTGGGGGGDALIKVPASALVANSPLALAPPVPTATVQQPPPNSAAPVGGSNNAPAAIPASPLADSLSPQTPASANAPAANAPAANAPAANAPVANAPVANAPAPSPAAANQGFMQSLSAALAVSTVDVIPVEAANSPAANQPATNQPASNPPTANPPLANTPVQNVANSPAQNVPAANAPIANAPAANGPATNPPAAAAPVPLNVGGQQVQQQGSTLVVGGQSIAPGSAAAVAGHQVVNDGNNVVVDGSSQAIVPNPTPPAPLPSVGGQQIQQEGSNLVVAGQTIAPGSSGTVAGHSVVNDGNNVVVDGSSQAFQATPAPVLVAGSSGGSAVAGGVAPAFQGALPAAAAAPLPTVGGQPVQQQGSNLVVAGQTIAPGASVNVAGHQVANNGDAVVVDGSSQALSPAAITPAPVAPAVTIGGTPYTADSAGNFVVNGQTLNSDNPITVSGTPVSILPGSSAIAIGSETQPISQPTSGPASPIVSVGGVPYTADGSGNFVIAGQTLNSSNPITVSGTPISILRGNSVLAVGSSTEPIVTPPPAANNANSPAEGRPGLTIDGSTYYPTGPSSAYVLPGGQTLTPGAQITVSGTPISLASDGSAAVVGGITEGLAPTITPAPGQPLLTVDGTTYRPTGPLSAYVIDGQTLSPGSGPITVSGTAISLATNGASAVIGSSTQNLQMTQPPLVFGGSIYYPTGPSSNYIIDGQTITPGASTTISGTAISLASDGASAVVGTSTEDLMPSLTSGAVLTVGGESFAPNPSSFVLAGKTMTVGGSAIISGTPVILEPGGTLMVGTSDIPLATASGTLGGPTSSPFTGSAAERKVPWAGLTLGLIGTGLLYIL